MAAVVRVQPSNGGWQVEVDGRSFLFTTQGEAEIVGRRVARTENLEFSCCTTETASSGIASPTAEIQVICRRQSSDSFLC